ncbi:hypothetical protein Misp01_10550 [Microtetraspora sp. NBRC 13810]|uniref:protein kinase domain-containing protein n=1 Tax=Microtetraspora sp. NBRC 13810 TaxID=3030990 RepID=UPI0024A3F695|nr:serine/threonine-protein kinase [Microtetraspora sp. NBRC 13810]GLW05925.1 hypothetical protein Misp01_10550 [Microtetraspora sp. NBRC 13810]
MGVSALRSGDPERVGPYRILGRLGQGGQGVVFLGVRAGEEAGERVAVKMLHATHAERPEARARFRREIEVARQIAEFCTARVLDVGEAGDSLYVVSEFIEGVSLQHGVERDGPRTGTPLQRIAVGTVTALAAIHQAGIVHRDFKPGNVLLGPDGPRVIDFGISRALDASAVQTTGGAFGTPTYMAPEQIDGPGVGPAADVFAWAGTMVFAATGRPAFGEDSVPAILHRVLSAEPDLSGVPDTLRPLLAACLAKDPGARPTAPDLLLRLITHTPPPPALPVSPAPPPQQAPRRDRGGDTAPPAVAGPGWNVPGAAVTVPPRAGGRRLRRRVYVALGAGVGAVVVAGAVVLPPLLDSRGEPDTRGEPVSRPSAELTPAAGTPPTAGPPPGPTPLALPTTPPVRAGGQTGRAVAVLRGHTDDAQSVATAHVGGRTVIVSGANDRTVRLWDLTSRRALGTLTGHTNWVRQVATTEIDGRPVAVSVGDDRTLRVWDLTTRRALGRPITTSESLFSVDTAILDGRPVAIAGGGEGRLWVWDLGTRKRVGEARRAHNGAIFDLAVAETGGAPAVFTAGQDGQVRMWRLDGGENDGQTVTTHDAQVSAVTTAELDGSLAVLSAGADQVIKVEDPLSGGEVRAPIRGHTGWIYTLAVTRIGEGVAVVSGGNDGTARVTDLATRKLVGRPFAAHDHNVFGAAVAEDGDRLLAVTAGGEDNIRIWRLT